ncbi:nuclear transport factor 2 family protein [Roseateles sp.]|uniref:nuclear transport factor 2 family protein n=1 Tax=Roseateles sp. TaxID=1971397 RepID=UPI0025FB05AA|nr:nuclear transport factor 2 family protein [Roseateles sp.]MBV8037494.1 nuclear transport factor 2 family protein [Roseateles sp.]
MTHPIDTWHKLVRARSVSGLDALLAEDAVLHSPVVHTPQKGRAIVRQYLSAALAVLANDSFRYVREIRGEHDALLEFELELAGVQVNGVDIIRWNDAGQIVDFKVMVRPLKGMQAVHQKMGELLAQMQKRPQ